MKINKITAVISAVVLCISFMSCGNIGSPDADAQTEKLPDVVWRESEEEAEAAKELDYIREGMKYIIHAAGRLEGIDSGGVARPYDGSNSLEGLRQCASAGCEVIELDFNFTSDGKLACIHDWYRQYAEEITDYVPLSLEDFLKCKIYGNFTPIWLGDVCDFLRENEGVYIVTDIKDKNAEGAAAIAEFAPDLKNRFIIQIYGEEEYETIRALGFDYIVYTLYRLDWNSKTDWKALGKFAKSHPLVGYTFSYELCPVKGYVNGMLKSGVPLYIHTVNGDAEQQQYFDMGIKGIYTDDVK